MVRDDGARSTIPPPEVNVSFHAPITVGRSKSSQNIGFGAPAASRSEIERAAKAAHAHDFIMGFERGYDTAVGERGLQLSGGQRARIAIARAIVRNAPIILLDEATAALDNESEIAVQMALGELCANRTTLVIAHRLQTVQHAHKICVLERGRLVEEGTHKELLARRGKYYHLQTLHFRQEAATLERSGRALLCD